MTQNAGEPQSPGSYRRLLVQSRLGRRLLIQFVACALIPTAAVALLSFKSVAGQLTEQGRERLAALSAAAEKTLADRLTFFETDLRKEAPHLVVCAAMRDSRACGVGLLYAAEGVAVISSATLRPVAGEASAVQQFPGSALPALEPGQSTLVTPPDAAASRPIYLVHRSAGRGSPVLIARLSPEFLWGSGDADALPGNVMLTLLDPAYGTLLGAPSEPAALTRAAASAIAGGKATGSFEWPQFLAAYSTLSPTPGFLLPAWRVVASEPRADVIAPARGFTRTFPLVVAAALVGVLALSLSQIRRSLKPLGELGAGTRRIAAGEFRTPVRVTSGDELEELGGAFNAMATKLEHQLQALESAAEIDRAILSSVDTATIAQSVLDRVPEAYPCEGLSLTVLGPGGGNAGSTWMEVVRGGARARVATELTPADVAQTLQHPEWMLLGDESLQVPGYLAHLDGNGNTALVACPLHHGGDLLGVLALRDEPGRRCNETLLQLRRLADRVAVALSNASMMDQVRVLAFYDSLTRLPNRVLYRERLGQAIGRAQYRKNRLAVCSLDLDHFSRINDTLGHGLGDRLLQEVATRLVASCRQEQANGTIVPEGCGVQVCRLGGDEFTIIMPDLTESADALAMARRMLAVFQQPFHLASQEVFATASVGIALYPEDGGDSETLHKNADVAMAHAKHERNSVELYSASMNAKAQGRMQLESELRKAVEHGEFRLWYQPIVDLRTLWPVGAEALVRWEHPERGLVSPGDFIGLCEEAGLIVPLGEWILRDVCTQARAWEEAGLGALRFSVNLSARQLRQHGVVQMVQSILDETGVQPGALSIELTESLLMEQGGMIERRIRELAEMGVALAIDDFGTGYSSLSYLKNFPVSTLKVDRSFIIDVTVSPDAAAITTAIIALARAMELDVVAEGVETKAQATYLRDRGCQKAQGYLFGKPEPVERFTDYLRSQRRADLRRRPRERAAI